MFWDSSALVPLLLPEETSVHLESLLGTDTKVILWWGTVLECQSAIYRRHRVSALPEWAVSQARTRLRALAEVADSVSPTDEVRVRAGRLLALHPLRAADALQLAAALVWCREQPTGETFVCLDQRLREAALREGFTVLPQD